MSDAYASMLDLNKAIDRLMEDRDAALKRSEAACDERDRLALRLAGALTAAEGGDGCPPGAIDAIRECPTIKAVTALRGRAEAAEAALAKMTGERDRCCDDYQREAARAEKAEAEVARLKGLFEWKRPVESSVRVIDLGSCNQREPKTPAERAAAVLLVAPLQPQVLREHLAYLEADAAVSVDCASDADWDKFYKSAQALRAAVARRDGGGK